MLEPELAGGDAAAATAPPAAVPNAGAGDAGAGAGLDASATSIEVTATGDVEELNVADTINNLFLAERPRLNRGHFERYDMRAVVEQSGEVIAATAALEECTTVLERHRMLFLVGEAETGKTTLARRLAAELQGRSSQSELWLCRHGPERSVEVRIDSLAGAAWRERFLVFREPLERENADLDRFIRDLGEARVAELGVQLTASSTFLVFTAERGKLAGAEARLHGLGVLHDLAPLPTDLLREGLAAIACRMRIADRSKLEHLLSQSAQHIVERLGTMPRIARFAQEMLADVVLGQIDLEAALGRADSLESWFLQDLPDAAGGFDAWCYCLALVLCHAAACGDSVSWFEFDALRRELERFLERRLRSTRTPRTPQSLCRESSLCRAVRAEVVQPGFPERCSIRFRQASYPAQLWRVLLGPGRALLGLLRPLLGDLTAAGPSCCRTLAVQITGRIGELDPNELVLLEIRRGDLPLGPLFQGILASEDDRYRAHCMQRFREILIGPGIARATAAVRALVDLGQVDLALALAELRAVCDGELAPRVSWETLGPAVARLEDDAATDAGAVRALAQIKQGTLRPLLGQALPPRCVAYLDAVRSCLVGLSLRRGPVVILAELNAWRSGDTGPALGRLLTLLYFHSTGVFGSLGKLAAGAGGSTRVMLTDAATTPYLGALADFLVWAHAGAAFFPGALRQGLRRSWVALLKEWSRQAAGDEELRATVLRLLQLLLAAEAGEVGAAVLHMLRRDPDFSRGDADLVALAAEAITGVP